MLKSNCTDQDIFIERYVLFTTPNKFEDRIKFVAENDMDVKERKEFEKFLSDHPEYQSKVEEVRNTISVMNQAPILKVSSDFDANLNQRLKTLGLNENIKKSIFLIF